MRVAILDDYQQVALASADWSAVRELAEIHVFAQHIGRTEALVSALEPYDVVVAMRERTPFDAERLGQLPRLRLLVTTGMSNASIDLDALDMPVVISSRSRGNWPSRSPSNGVRSRMATMTSYGSRALTSASVRPMCWAKTSIAASSRTADQSALASATC